MELLAIESQQNVDAAWEAEIDSRMRSVLDGTAKLYSFDSVLEKLRTKLVR